MRPICLFIFLAAFPCLCVAQTPSQSPVTNKTSPQTQGPATSSATATATVQAAGPAKKAGGQQAKPKYLVYVFTLTVPSIRGCDGKSMTFPATNADKVALALAFQDYTFKAVGSDQIAAYYTSKTASPGDVTNIKGKIDDLALADFNSGVAVSLRGSATKALKQLNLPSDGPITARVVSEKCVVLLSKTRTPDPVALAAIQQSLPEAYWHIESTSPVQRLFHLDATTVAKQLAPPSSSSTDKSGGSTSTDSSSKSPDSSNASKSASPSSSVAQNVALSIASGGSAAGKPAGDPNAAPGDESNSDDSGGNGANPSNSATASPKAQTPAAAPASTPPPKPPTMQPVSDMLVYSNDDGTDHGFFERNRLMAILDLPRPEVLMNIWSLQISTGNAQTASREADAASELISYHNEALENSIENGWKYLSSQIGDAGKVKDFFEPRFYEYVTQKFAEGKSYVDNADPLSLQDKEAEDQSCELLVKPGPAPQHEEMKARLEEAGRLCERKKKRAQLAAANWDQGVGYANRRRWGWCSPNQYCLGFIHAFEPVRPTLTNLLLTIMAAKNSATAATGVIDAIECPEKPAESKPCDPPSATKAEAQEGKKTAKNSKVQTVDPLETKSGTQEDQKTATAKEDGDKAVGDKFDSCVSDKLKELNTFKRRFADDCELQDRIALLDRSKPSNRMQTLQLNCFREQAGQSFSPNSSEQGGYGTTRVGLLRAAVADFLFNYKWATEYPHDFVPYDLTQSAQELNAEFNPLVLAFNRDVKAFTQNLETELQCKHDAYVPSKINPLAVLLRKTSDDAFINDGMISVRGISGVESIVDTVTQSFFDATKPPSLTDLVKSVSDAEKNIPGVLKTNLSANEAAVLLGALNSVQPAESKIGRELKLDITPHTLAGASSAELEVKLTADETTSPTLFKADKETEDTISRVAKHDTNTRVRVESLKLFDVSSFSAMLQRPRSKFPLLPPFFEVPYFGTFIGWPLAGAKVFHRSTAIVSAIIVPTAADLAFGIEFSTDRVCDQSNNSSLPLTCHYARSPSDFGSLPLRSFHKAMVQCFASGGKTAYAGLLLNAVPEADAADKPCAHLSLVNSDGATQHFAEPEKTILPEFYVPPL